jgi:hypothetical protein
MKRVVIYIYLGYNIYDNQKERMGIEFTENASGETFININ